MQKEGDEGRVEKKEEKLTFSLGVELSIYLK